MNACRPRFLAAFVVVCLLALLIMAGLVGCGGTSECETDAECGCTDNCLEPRDPDGQQRAERKDIQPIQCDTYPDCTK